MAKPKPVPKTVVCSICDLPWEDHTKGRKTEPTADVCIRLLKAELAKRPYWPPKQWLSTAATGTDASNVSYLNAAVGK